MISRTSSAIRISQVALVGLAMLMLAAASGAQDSITPNVLLVILDDVGVDLVGAYGEHPNPANTPTIDALAAGGLLFRNAWSNPTCSPTRSLLLTGRHSFRTGWGLGIAYLTPGATEFPIDEVSVADVVGATYDTAAVGKWHLSSAFMSGTQHPLLMGFDHHWGPMDNVSGLAFGNAYFNYTKNVDGVLVQSTTYATTDQVDDTLTLIDTFQEPWFVWLAFSAAHGPFHAPPDNLHSYNLPATVPGNIPIHVRAMTEALDTELGRLLASLDPTTLANTVVIVLGDNGTADVATTPPFVSDHAKGTVYEGGINVPLIVNGPGVPAAAESSGLVSVTDVIATVAELAGAGPVSAEDSLSLVPYFSDPSQPSLRPWIYAERFLPNGFVQPYATWNRAVRDSRYKLIHDHVASFLPANTFFFDLLVDPFESTNLLDGTLNASEQAAFDALSTAMTNLLLEAYVPWIDVGFGKAGTNGVPSLVGAGGLQSGQNVSLHLTAALANTPVFFLLGFAQANLPLLGGTLVPDMATPGGIVLGLQTDGTGSLSLSTSWPVGMPTDLPFYVQEWIVDPGATLGFAASNGLRAVTL